MCACVCVCTYLVSAIGFTRIHTQHASDKILDLHTQQSPSLGPVGGMYVQVDMITVSRYRKITGLHVMSGLAVPPGKQLCVSPPRATAESASQILHHGRVSVNRFIPEIIQRLCHSPATQFDGVPGLLI